MKESIDIMMKTILDEMYKHSPFKLFNINLFEEFQQFSKKDIKTAINSLIDIGYINTKIINLRHMDYFYESFNGFFTDEGILEYESYDFGDDEKFSMEFIRLLNYLEEVE